MPLNFTAIFSKTILLLAMFFGVLISVANTTQVTVIDGSLGSTLPYAHVKFTNLNSNKSIIIITNLEGEAILSPEEDSIFSGEIALHISYIGFNPVDDTINKGSSNKIKLFANSEMLDQVVITGQYSASSPEKSVHKVTIISNKKIEALNAVSLDQVLSRELNMNVSQGGVLGSSISIQGLSGENVKILIDGVPMVGRLNGSIDLSQINLNNIERIEVIEGPLSVSYGSNALAGTINLITKKESKKPLNANVKYYGESVGTHNFNGRIGLSKGKHFGALTLTRNFFNGWNIGDPAFNSPELIADSTRSKLWKPRTQLLGGIKYGYKLKTGSILLNVNGFDETITNRGLPRGPYNEVAFDSKFNTTRLNTSITLDFKIDTVNTLQVIAAYNYYQRERLSFITDLTGVASEPNQDPTSNDTTFTDLKMMRATFSGSPRNKKWRYQIGTDLNLETARGVRILDNQQSIGDYAGFMSLEWQPTFKWTIRPGVRVSHNTKYGSPVVPSIYAKYQLKPSMAIRGSIARGFRAPSVKELYMNFVDVNHDIQGNQDLKAETALHTSLNYTYTRLVKSRLLKLKLGVFYNHIQNQITLAQSTGTEYSYANIDEAISVGFNTSGQYTVGHLKANLGFSYIGTQNHITETDPTHVLFSPQVTSSVSYAFKKAKVDLNVFYKFTGRVPQVVVNSNGDLQQNYTDSYNILDFTVNKKLWKDRIVIGSGIKNILNVTNISSAATGGAHSGGGSRPIAPGRVYFLKLGLQF